MRSATAFVIINGSGSQNSYDQFESVMALYYRRYNRYIYSINSLDKPTVEMKANLWEQIQPYCMQLPAQERAEASEPDWK